MAFIRNTDKLIEGSSQLFFTNQRAKGAVQVDLDSLSLSISSEQSSRQSADNAMILRLNTLEGNAAVEGSVAKAEQDAKDYADAKIAALVNSAPSVLDTLKELSDALGGDANFAATVAGQIGTVDGKVSQEILDRSAAISALNLRVVALEADPVTKSYVDSEIASEESARMAAISDEQSARQSADSALSGRLESLEADPVTKTYVDGQVSSIDGRLDALEQDDTTKTYVDGLVSGLDSRIDVLELDPVTKTYVDSQDSGLQGQITQEISDRQGAVSAEEARAMAAEGLLDGRLDILEQDPTTKSYVDGEVSDLQGQITQEISDRQGAISSEQSARMSADQALDGRLDILEQDPVTKTYVDGEVSDLSSQLSQEMSAIDARIDILEQDPVTKGYVDGEVSDLQGQITQEISDRQSAITSVEGMISAEESRAMSAESALDGRLDILELDPVTKTYVDGIQSVLDGRMDVLEADPVTQAYVDSEVSDLQGQINNVLSNVDPAAIDSLSEVVAAFEAADSSINGAISSLSSGLDARLDVLEADPTTKSYVDSEMSAEESARMSADSALGARLDVLELDPVTKSYVDSEMGSEESARIAADNALDTRLDSLELDPVTKSYVDSADGAMDMRLDALELDSVTKTYVDGEVSDLQGQITQEISDRQSAVSSEASARQSADNALDTRLDSLEADPTTKSYVDSKVTLLQSEDLTMLKLDGSRNMTGGLAFTGTSKNITWASDGGGNIGASGANRPSNVYVKDTVYIGGFISIQQNMAWVSDGSGDIGASGNFRPNNIYAKTSVTSSGKAVFTQSNAANPGYTFGGATNFGMYYDTNTVGLSAQGQAALTCTAGTVAAVKPLAMMSGYSLVRTAVAGNLTVTSSHGLIAVTDTAAARVITLPAANTVTNRHFIIKDESGSASVSNYIRIAPQSGQLIDGQSNFEIVVPYESVIVYSNGTSWFIV
jgi:hypothetical protein